MVARFLFPLASEDHPGDYLYMVVDFGKTASDYAQHRAGFPDRFFDRLFQDGLVTKTDRVLDVGTGTGTVARGLAQRGCAVTGLDPSRALLDQARSLDRNVGVEIHYVEAKAEQTGLPDDTFDVVIAGQCWHWFDRPKAATEARRLLAPGGRLIIAHFDWLPLPGNVVEATEKLIQVHNPARGAAHKSCVDRCENRVAFVSVPTAWYWLF
jgi:ubiquinone/menaquinone biosynthesis C-methylase UbiE